MGPVIGGYGNKAVKFLTNCYANLNGKERKKSQTFRCVNELCM
jgi:hypothetical protein